MITEEQKTALHKEATTFFDKLGSQGVVSILFEEETGVTVSIVAEEPQLLIGEKGQTLFEIQHILRMILKKHLPEETRLNLDVNDYRKNKEVYLRELARETADEVSLTKKEKELQPMPAVERRIIHMELAERTDIASDSVGEGVDRRVVIRTT